MLGFGIRSEKTGRVVYFMLESAHQNEDDKYEWWGFTTQGINSPEIDLYCIISNE